MVGDNTKLGQDKIIDEGPLSRDLELDAETQRVRKGSESLVVWLKHGPNSCSDETKTKF